VVFLPSDARHAVDLVVRAEQAAVGTAWLEINAIGLDPLLLLAAAAKQTERIGLGTAILPAFSRHPVALATQALSLEGLAPGRLRLGIGTGNALRMAEAFHHPTDRPLARLREYVQVVRPLLREGTVRFAGEFYSADAQIGEPPMTPVLLSALGTQAFAAAGELADGHCRGCARSATCWRRRCRRCSGGPPSPAGHDRR
jgi:5,10-methylenetetrahydromethanopterin reductase